MENATWTLLPFKTLRLFVAHDRLDERVLWMQCLIISPVLFHKFPVCYSGESGTTDHGHRYPIRQSSPQKRSTAQHNWNTRSPTIPASIRCCTKKRTITLDLTRTQIELHHVAHTIDWIGTSQGTLHANMVVQDTKRTFTSHYKVILLHRSLPIKLVLSPYMHT